MVIYVYIYGGYLYMYLYIYIKHIISNDIVVVHDKNLITVASTNRLSSFLSVVVD